jgi:hypothetical protein
MASAVLQRRHRELSCGRIWTDGTVRWVGDVPGLFGNYSAALEIKILWGSFVGKFTNFSLSNEYQSIMVEGKDSARQLDVRLDFRGYNVLPGTRKDR